MKKFYCKPASFRTVASLLFATFFSVGQYLVVAPEPAIAAPAKVTICHRTHSVTNPYRRISVSNSSINKVRGHKDHDVSSRTPKPNPNVFDPDFTYDSAGKDWGDIVIDGMNYSGSGLNIYDGTGTSPGGKSYAGLCGSMTAKQFYDIEIAAGQSSASILQDLEDQEANDDKALRAALGGSFVGADVTKLESVKATTQAATSITRTSATLNGALEVGILTSTFFEWGTDSTLSTLLPAGAPVAATPSSLSATTSVASRSISKGLTGLTANTTYYFRAFGITNSGTDLEGRINGEILSFTTATGSSRLLAINSSSYSGAPYELSAAPITITSSTDDATDTSGTKSYSSSTTGVCTVTSTGIVTFVSAGTCTIDASISANGDDALANASAISFEITANSRTLTINSSSYSGSYTLSATPPTITSSTNNSTDGSGAKSYSSSTTSVCTINASTGVVTFVATGTCTIAATIAANGANASATASSISFTVSSNPTPGPSPQATTPTTVASTTTTVRENRNVTTTVAANIVNNARRISICHATSSATNPYVLITVDRNSLNGHGGHAGDIIPAPAGGCPTTLVSQIATTTTSTPAGRITICHATAAGTYVQITVNRSSLNGHEDHLDDLIPAPSGGCPYSIRQYALQLANTTTSVAPGIGSVTTAPRTPAGKITICHATAAGFYVELTVDRNGLNGHDRHDGDMVPAPAEGCPTGVSRQSTPKTATTVPDGKISICHATAAGIYVSLTVDRNGLNGHDKHEGDIIPAPTGGCPSRVSAQSSSSTLPGVPAGKIGICHATNRGTFVYKVVDADDLDGHDEHEQDIIPAPIGGCTSPSSTIDLPLSIACINAREISNLDESNSSLTDGVKVDATQSPTDEESGTIKISKSGSGPALSLVGVESVDPDIEITVKSSGVDYNKPVTWVNEGYGTYCWKLEPFGDRDYIYTLPNPPAPPDARYAGLAYSTVIVKAGSLTTTDPNYQVNTLFDSPAAGTGVFADVNKNGVSDPGGQGGGTIGDKSISHIVLCVGSQSFVEKAPTTTLPTSSTFGALQTTTTTINWSADFCPESTTTTSIADSESSSTTTFTTTTTTTTIAGDSATSSTTTTIVGGSTTTTIAGDSATSTTASPSTTLVTTTTLPGGTEDPNPPIEFFVKALKASSSGVTDLVLTLSDGVTSEVVFLKLNVKNFSVVETSLPATGQERWSTEQQLGWLLFITGALLGIIEIRRRETLRR